MSAFRESIRVFRVAYAALYAATFWLAPPNLTPKVFGEVGGPGIILAGGFSLNQTALGGSSGAGGFSLNQTALGGSSGAGLFLAPGQGARFPP